MCKIYETNTDRRLFSIYFNHQSVKVSKIERLNARVEELLCKAVQEVLEVVKETVSEYQEKTARTQRENQSLKRRLRELQDKLKLESNGKTTCAKYLCPEMLKLFDKNVVCFVLSPLLLCRNCATNLPCSSAG